MILKFILSGLALAVFVTQAFAQGFSVESKSPPSVVGAGTFVSLEGRFSIALPADTHGFRPVAINSPAGKLTGDAYSWTMKEGSFTAGFADAAQSIDDAETVAKIFSNIREGMSAWAISKNGRLASDRQLDMDKHPGLEVKLEFPEGNLWQRFCVESNRIFQLVVLVKSNQLSDEAVALKALDSFKILSAAEASAALKAKVAAAEPAPLPQEPVAARGGSDAADDGLRGEVKTVYEENEDLSGTWSRQGRIPDSMASYDKNGNLTRHEQYDYKGNLSGVTIYGYIDGARVSSYKRIEREYNPPPMAVQSPAGEVKKSDPRYSNRFAFRYDDQKRLVEKTGFFNNGVTAYRTVYKYSGNQRESFSYSRDNVLNQHFLFRFDDKGNEAEKIDYNPRDGSVRERYSYGYEFDAKGNWIKRVVSTWVTKDGKSNFMPKYVEYRTITYH